MRGEGPGESGGGGGVAPPGTCAGSFRNTSCQGSPHRLREVGSKSALKKWLLKVGLKSAVGKVSGEGSGRD